MSALGFIAWRRIMATTSQTTTRHLTRDGVTTVCGYRAPLDHDDVVILRGPLSDLRPCRSCQRMAPLEAQAFNA